MTKTAAAVSCKVCSTFVADTTFTCIKSSMLNWVKSGVAALAGPAAIPKQTKTINGGTIPSISYDFIE